MKLLPALLTMAVLAFSRGAAQSAGDAGAATPFEFNGLVIAGERTLVCITSQPDQRSRWIAVGAQMDGIRIARFDRNTQQVVVEQGGRSHTITLKRASTTPLPNAQVAAATNQPLPIAAPAAPVAVTDADKEREARFLVSDLLEIGMIQRKAYEEAQRKTAEEKKAAAATNE